MVLASSLSVRHPKQSLSSSISGPPVTKTDVLLASARPTQKSGCQQTSWMGLISPWSRFWTRLDPAKPSTHVPEGAPAEAEANRWPLWSATACQGRARGEGANTAAPGLRPGCCPSTATHHDWVDAIWPPPHRAHPSSTLGLTPILAPPCRVDPGSGIVCINLPILGRLNP